jgi:hypothetical protein
MQITTKNNSDEIFFNNIFKKFINIEISENFKNINKKDSSDILSINSSFNWHSDNNGDDKIISSPLSYNLKKKFKIIEIDIKSAYPTIIHNMYSDNNSQLLLKLNKLKTKKEKNIFIGKSFNNEILKRLNQISKMIIIGIILEFHNYLETKQNNNIFLKIFEIKRDSCVFLCGEFLYKSLYKILEDRKIPRKNKFMDFIFNCGFRFHYSEYDYYLRLNSTSNFINIKKKELIRKGKFKYIPKALPEYIFKIITKKITDNDLIYLKKIYSFETLKKLRKYKLHKIIDDYYKCIDFQNKTNKFKFLLSSSNKKNLLNYYNSFNLDINPSNYLKVFIFPFLIVEKLNFNN